MPTRATSPTADQQPDGLPASWRPTVDALRGVADLVAHRAAIGAHGHHCDSARRGAAGIPLLGIEAVPGAAKSSLDLWPASSHRPTKPFRRLPHGRVPPV